MTPTSLYVHVPFCLRRCSYCDFAVTPTRRPPVDEWLASVARELATISDEQGWTAPLRLKTLYVGGGTPSLIGGDGMVRLLDHLRQWAELKPDAEWTAEANPETLTEEVAREWRESGVNRISLGVQTFWAPALRWMGRLHGADGARLAVRAARAAGFRNLNLDLIFGLPVRLGRNWAADLDQALDLDPEHISLYGLTAEKGTALGRWVGEGREKMVDEETYADEYRVAAQRLSGAGFDHYEVSNFARSGFASRHNEVYWKGGPYIGLGPGAHSFLPPMRRWNVRDWKDYAARIADGGNAVESSETLDPIATSLERIWLSLRTQQGYQAPLAERQEQLVKRWTEAGWATRDYRSVRLTAEGWLLLDQLAVELSDS